MLKKLADRKLVLQNELKGGEGIVSILHCFSNDEFSSKIRHCSTTIIPPGASIGLHKHENEEEVYILIEGQGILNDGKSKMKIEKGDVILTKSGESHSVINSGKDDLKIIAVIVCY